MLLAIAGPGHLHHPLTIDQQIGHIGTSTGMHRDALASRDVPDDRLAPDRLTAGGEVGEDVVDPLDGDPVIPQPEGSFNDARHLPDLGIARLFERRQVLLGEEPLKDLSCGQLSIPDGRKEILDLGIAALLKIPFQTRILEECAQLEAQSARLLLEELSPHLDRGRPLLLRDDQPDLAARLRGDNEVEPVTTRLVAGCRQDLDDIRVLNLVAERHNPPVDFRAGTLISDFGMDGVGEIDRGRVSRKGDDLALRGAGVDLLRVEVHLEGIDEVEGVGQILLGLDQAAQPAHVVVFARIGALALLVFPVGGNPLLGDPMHLLGPDLYLEMMPLLTDHRSVERLVAVLPRGRDKVLDPVVERLPVFVHHPQDMVTVEVFAGNDPDGRQIIDLLEGNLLPLELEVDAVEALDPSLDANKIDALLPQPLRDAGPHLDKKGLF